MTAVDGSSVSVTMDDGGMVIVRCTGKLPVVDDRVEVRRDANFSAVISGLSEGFS